MKLTNEIKEILEDIVWWDTCPTEYKFKINAYLKSVNEPKALNIDFVIERLKSLDSCDVQEVGYYGEGLEERSFENLTGDYIRTEDLKKIIQELSNAL